MNIKVNGTGVAVKQEFEPGTYVNKGQVVDIEFKQLDNIE